MIFKGTSVIIEGTVYQKTDVLANLSGSTITVLIKRNHNDSDADALYTKTIGSGVTITDAANGRFDVQILSSETNSLGFNIIYWEALVKLSTGQHIRTGVEEIELVDNLIKVLN